jgi:hypothetical protein
MQLLTKPNLQEMPNDNRLLFHQGFIKLLAEPCRIRIRQHNQKLLKLLSGGLQNLATSENALHMNALIFPRQLVPISNVGDVHKEPNVQLRHAGPNDVNREAELEPPSRVACSDLLENRFFISKIVTPRESDQRASQ